MSQKVKKTETTNRVMKITRFVVHDFTAAEGEMGSWLSAEWLSLFSKSIFVFLTFQVKLFYFKAVLTLEFFGDSGNKKTIRHLGDLTSFSISNLLNSPGTFQPKPGNKNVPGKGGRLHLYMLGRFLSQLFRKSSTCREASSLL